ncbi:hypothetical protein [Psychromonas sp. SP041]|uniref:hypothetical protein n=1 Tax=Psychromonas sp. SP041 TaxID=1365007 RepID=UPI00041BF1E7|nr:hypothetical protein [Psychromonas sp. SP041]
MEANFSLDVSNTKGANQFIDQIKFRVFKEDQLVFSICAKSFNWALANELSLHPVWAKNIDPMIKNYYPIIFDDGAKKISLSKVMSDMIFFDDPVVYIESINAFDSKISSLEIFLGMFNKYFEDRISLLVIPKWKMLGDEFTLLESETINILSTLGISIYDDDVAIRFMESKTKIEEKILDSDNYSYFD